MGLAGLIRYLERNYSPQIPVKSAGKGTKRVLAPGSTVIVVGGGIAGSSFARQILMLAQQEQVPIKVIIVNSSNCNYCGGLVTSLSESTLNSLYGLNVPDELVLKRIEKCVYINGTGSFTVDLHTSLAALLRTSRFGIEGFDDSIKDRITDGLKTPWADSLVDIEPTIVTKIKSGTYSNSRWEVTLSKRHPGGDPMVVEGDILVLAGGVRALNRPMALEFQGLTGYIPPSLMPASVTEIDTSKAVTNSIGNRMFIIDNIFPEAVVALIPKGANWLTLTCLGQKLVKSDLDTIFSHPVVKRFIDLPRASETPRCHTICGATVFTGPARNFYGDGWVVIGDMAGYGRVLKDGYFAAFLGAHLAARTIVYHGATRQAFSRHYHGPLRVFEADNRVGMTLFKANQWLQQRKWFSSFFLETGVKESFQPYGGLIHGAVRALASGELNYRLIAALFVFGLGGFWLRHPILALRAVMRKAALSGPPDGFSDR